MAHLPDFSHDPVAVFINQWIYNRPAAERLYPDIWAAELADALWREFGPIGIINRIDPAEAATSSRDYGRGYSQALADVKAAIEERWSLE